MLKTKQQLKSSLLTKCYGCAQTDTFCCELTNQLEEAVVSINGRFTEVRMCPDSAIVFANILCEDCIESAAYVTAQRLTSFESESGQEIEYPVCIKHWHQNNPSDYISSDESAWLNR